MLRSLSSPLERYSQPSEHFSFYLFHFASGATGFDCARALPLTYRSLTSVRPGVLAILVFLGFGMLMGGCGGDRWQSTPIPATPTPAQRVAKVGERVVSGGIAVTVNAVQRLDQMTAPGGVTFEPEAGYEYVVVDVTIENVERDQAPYNPLYFEVKDSDGHEYSTSLSIDPQALKSGELARGDRVRGTVAFAVPKGKGGLVLSYQPLILFGGYQTIRVALD